MRSNRKAFTLVEIMVVILIIGLLAAVLSVAVSAIFGENKNKEATIEMQGLRSGIDRFEREFRFFPPNAIRALPAMFREKANIVDNNVNSSSESMFLALRARLGSGPFINDDEWMKDERHGNLDNDKEIPNFAKVDGKAIPYEALDPWGNPYIYVNLAGIEKLTLAYQIGDGTRITIDGKKLMAALKDKENGRQKAHGYVIWSLGEDGKNDYGAGDDINSWE